MMVQSELSQLEIRKRHKAVGDAIAHTVKAGQLLQVRQAAGERSVRESRG